MSHGPAYYNEHDAGAAEWLRELIRAGHIAPGDVDERSIVDVQPGDLVGYTQCHFFAGIGVWSYALRSAGWPDDRPVWTGSCPCQPFSAAGKREGHADERHLWPAWFRLIRECRPVVVFGEQVANGDGAAWLDSVATDLEGIGYAVGAVSAPACGFGAPHIRQRLYFVADAESQRRGETWTGSGRSAQWIGDGGESGRMANSERRAAERWGLNVAGATPGIEGQARQRQRVRLEPWAGVATGELVHAKGATAGSGDDLCRRESDAGAASVVGHSDDARPQGRRVPEITRGGGA